MIENWENLKNQIEAYLKNQITVGEVRKTEGDVIRTSGRSPHHATLSGLTSEQISNLLTPTYANPAREQ